MLLEETLAGASYCFAGVVVEVFLSLVVVIAVCSVGMASTELVWIVAGPLALASEVEKCTSVDALDEGSISCVCLGLMKLVFHQYSAPFEFNPIGVWFCSLFLDGSWIPFLGCWVLNPNTLSGLIWYHVVRGH